MRIALVNPVIQTVDRPKHFWSLFGRTPRAALATEEDVNFVKLAQTMADLGHDVTLFISDSFKPKQFYQPRGTLEIRYLETAWKFLFAPAYIPFLPTLLKELKKGAFDVIQTPDLLQPSSVIAALCHLPVFAWEETDQYFSRYPTRLLQKGLHHTLERWLQSRVTAIPRSQASLKFLKRRGFKKIKEVIPTPVDTDIFKPLPALKEEYLLVISRLASDRGLNFLLDAFAKVHRDEPHIKLVVVGSSSEQDHFKKEIAQRSLSNSIEILPHFFSHREIAPLYQKSYMTLVTTEGGLYPYTASESMACGKPVVSRFKRALRDLLHDGKTGYLADTPDEMAAKILFLLRNPRERHQMGEAAHEFVQEFCDLKKVARRFIHLYKEAALQEGNGSC